MSELGEIVIILIQFKQMTPNALHIARFWPNTSHTDDTAVFFTPSRNRVRRTGRNAAAGVVTQNRIGSRLRSLHHIRNLNRETIATKILYTLEASVRRFHAKMRIYLLDVARTTTSGSLEPALESCRLAQVIDISRRIFR